MSSNVAPYLYHHTAILSNASAKEDADEAEVGVRKRLTGQQQVLKGPSHAPRQFPHGYHSAHMEQEMW
jgi:hypothetical protein